MRRQPELEGFSIWHHVVVLGEGTIENVVEDLDLRFTFPVRYVRDEDHEELLLDPALAPFAAIADVDDKHRPDVLLRAARKIIRDGRPELLQATRDLALIRLSSTTIDEVWKELPMPIPTEAWYRYQEGAAKTIADVLQDRFGDDDRIPGIATRLAEDSDGWCQRVKTAESLDALLDDLED